MHNPECAEALELYAAEIDRLRAELADMTEERNKWRRISSHMSRLHDKSEVTVARLETLCDELQNMPSRELALEAAIARVRELVRHYDPSDPGAAYYSRGDILRALDGGTE